jgi:sterol desaturase/sphingolipid hydroxylase (fatty acid hydroxylase superfamily)
MSNARTFIWLLIYVQGGFISLDLYEHWRSAQGTSAREVIRANSAVIFAVGMACIGYSAIQLALASALPSIGKLTNFATRLTASQPLAPDARWVVPVFAVAFGVGTLFDYLVHRFLLHGPLWRLHENHHLPSVISNVMPGIAARPFVIVPNFLINAGSCATIFGVVEFMGRPQLISTFIHLVPALLLTFTFVACASHSNFLRRFDWVERVFRSLLLIGPREHLLHHAATIKGNYGNFTTVWDRAFGTYVAPQEAREIELGLEYDQDFLGAITAGRFKLPPALRSRFQIGRVCRLDEDDRPNPVAE